MTISIGASTIYKFYHPSIAVNTGRLMTFVGFSFLSVTFFTFGYLTLLKLQNAFLDFYAANRNKLIFATIGLSLPMLIRAFYDLFMVISTSFHDVVNKHTDVFNFVILLVCDIIPISLQFSSMVFGYIKQEDNKKFQKLQIGRSNLESDLSRSKSDTQSNNSRYTLNS